MRHPASLSIVLSLLLAPTVAAGETPSPFAVNVRAGYTTALPGEELPVAVIFDIAKKHKVYAETVNIGLAPDSAARLVRVDRPAPVEKHDDATGETRQVYIDRAVFGLAVEAPEPASGGPDEVSIALVVRFQGCSESVCFLPETREVELAVPVRPEREPPELVNQELFRGKEESSSRAEDFTRRNPAVAILLAFAFGLLLSFTPCVYPLVPVTMAVIGARSATGGWRKGLVLSLVYVLGLSVTYSVLGVVAAKGGDTVGAASRHPVVVSAAALLFLALAASLFGVYDLEMPSSWQAKLRMRKAGGPVGVFLMGLLSGLVATPCVAAPLASVLVFIATTGSVALGAAMLFAMAWGMGVLLVLAGTFSGFLTRLPKAGRWMLFVKTVLGVVLVVAALYFLRPVLPFWTFTAWVAVPLLGLGTWRGIIARTPRGASRRRLALRAAGIAALVFGVYFGIGALMRAGMPAPVVSGLYPDDVAPARSKIAFRTVKRRTDFEAALAEARESGRPVMIDFLLPNCTGCRELEENVFSRGDVAAEAERFVSVRIDLADPPVPVEELRETYGIFGAPSVVWIDGAGTTRRELTVADGGTPPEEFLRRMRDVK